MKVSIVCREAIKPSFPTPPEKRDFKLSFIDERTPHFYIALLLYYPYNDKTLTTESETLRCLKMSLSNTLTQFYPLAGRIKGQTLVDCNDEGAHYVEARVESSLRAVIDSPEAQELEQLVPFSKADGILSTTGELLGVQVNLFSCGGICIGICVSHKIADGCSMCTFVRAWAAGARGSGGGKSGSVEVIAPVPVFNSARLFPPRRTPDFTANEKSKSQAAVIHPPPPSLITKRYVFTPSAITEMKAKSTATNGRSTTRVEVVTAILWKSLMAAKQGGAAAANSITFFPINLRPRATQSPLPEYSFGNIYQVASAVTDGKEDWPCLAVKIGAAAEQIDAGYITKMRGEDGPRLMKENFVQIGRFLARRDFVVLRFTSWCGFPVYDIDYGWGKPGWVSIPSFGYNDFVTLLDSSSPGGVEAWVTMAKDDSIRLEQDRELQAFTTNNCM